jgi:hypothetical protein
MNEFGDSRKIKTTLRQLKSRLNSIESSLQKAPSRSFNTYKTKKSAGIQVSSPSRRQIFNFKEHFKEVLERFQIDSRPSLLELSSASLGKIAVFVNDMEMEDFYEAIPSHCRRYVLLGIIGR